MGIKSYPYICILSTKTSNELSNSQKFIRTKSQKFGINTMIKTKNMETIKNVWFENERIYILTDLDKVYSRPLEAFPLLKEAGDKEREAYKVCLHGTALRWENLDEDIHISSFYVKEEPNYDNEVAYIFSKFPQLNVSEVARSLGINKSLLSKYIYGIKKPSNERLAMIKSSLHALGRELMAV